MKSLTINGLKRESVGKKHTKALRNAESVPCVLYGKNPPLHFSAKELDFRKLVYTSKAYTVKLNVNNDSFDAIIQDIQFHPVSGKILHIDFYELSENKEISISIPVEITGSAPGVLISGGVLIINKRKLKVKALPKNLPDFITADISKLELGDTFTLRWMDASKTYDAAEGEIVHIMDSGNFKIDMGHVWIPINIARDILSMPNESTYVVYKLSLIHI